MSIINAPRPGSSTASDRGAPTRVNAPRPGGRTAARQENAPRPGGRAAARADRPLRTESRIAPPRSGDRGGEPEAFPTQGNTALRPEPVSAPEAPARGPRLRVAPPLPVMVPRAPFIALILVLVVGGVLGILVLNTKINENAFRLHDLQQRQSTLDQRQQELEQQLANYESPNNLAAAACKLGMVQAGAPAFIRLPDGRVIGVPQPATGDQCVSSRRR
jgi:cell division protein FtsB